jgi:hypothetical protein
MRLSMHMSVAVSAAIEQIGRTEDIHFSPSNKKLAVAGFRKNTLLILDVRCGADGVHLDTALTVNCTEFSYPHGLFWLNERTLIVANRGGEVQFVDVPDRSNSDDVRVDPVLRIRADETGLLKAPGSVSAFQKTPDWTDVLICNNRGDNITRHKIRYADTLTLESSEVVASDGLGIPDGVAYNHDGSWVAVSNHLDHSVFLYKSEDLGNGARPAGIIEGVAFPHGVRFAASGKVLLVADAGEPFVHVYSAADGDWSGVRSPFTSMQVIAEDAFKRGRHNEMEGGPKGIDLMSDGTP